MIKKIKSKKGMSDFVMWLIIALLFMGAILILYALFRKGILTNIALFFKGCSPPGGIS